MFLAAIRVSPDTASGEDDDCGLVERSVSMCKSCSQRSNAVKETVKGRKTQRRERGREREETYRQIETQREGDGETGRERQRDIGTA